MSKKKRKKKTTVYGAIEGDLEMAFINHLVKLFAEEMVNISFRPEHTSGGSATSIIKKALTNQFFDRCFAWLDEDFEYKNPPSCEIKERLITVWCIDEHTKGSFVDSRLGEYQHTFNTNDRKPILIVSQPVAVESLLLRLIDVDLPFDTIGTDLEEVKTQAKKLKTLFNSYLDGKTHVAFFDAKITKELVLSKRGSIRELDLLINQVCRP